MTIVFCGREYRIVRSWNDPERGGGVYLQLEPVEERDGDFEPLGTND